MIDQNQIATTQLIIDGILESVNLYKDDNDLAVILAAKTNTLLCAVLENQIQIMTELNEIRAQIPYRYPSIDLGPG